MSVSERLSDQLAQLTVPKGESLAHLVQILEPVVDARDTAECAGDMIQDALDYMRRDAKPSHMGGGSAPEIMQRPACDARCLVEPRLGAREAGDHVFRIALGGEEIGGHKIENHILEPKNQIIELKRFL